MAACPVCGEGLDRYHETEVTCRQCGGSFCPRHRRPDEHECDTSPTGTFGFEDGPAAGGHATRTQRHTGGRYQHGSSESIPVEQERRTISIILLALYLANVPLSVAGPLADHYPPTSLFVATGGLLVAYAAIQRMMRSGYHAWARVRLAVLLISLVLALALLGGGVAGAGAPRIPDIGSLDALTALAVGAPLVVYVGYRALGWLIGR